MDALFDRLLALVEAQRHLAVPVVALLAFGESMAVIGVLLPATAVLLAVGGLVGAGTLDPGPIIAGAAIGAILGDWVSYALGRWLGPRIFHRWPLNRYRHGVARTRLLFRRYGVLAVFAGRFIGPVRATVPLVAGVLRMNRLPFQLANILSACVWAPVLILPGYLAADAIKARGGLSEWEIAGIGLALVAAIAAIVWLSRRLTAAGARRANRPAR